MQIGDFIFQEQFREESPSVWQWRDNGSSVALTLDVTRADGGYIDPTDIPLNVLGYAHYQPALLTTPSFISRQMPLSLWDAPWLFAMDISNQHGIGDHQVQAVTALSGYRWFGNARFKRWRCTVRFDSPDYEILPDSALVPANNGGVVGTEFWRYVEKTYVPGVENVQRRQGTFKLVNGPIGVAGTSFQQGITRRVPKSQVLFRWHNVPVRAVLMANGIVNPNITRALCTCNDADFPAVTSPFDVGFNGTLVTGNRPLPYYRPNYDATGARTSTTLVLVPATFARNTLLLTQVGLKIGNQPVNPLDTGLAWESIPPRSLTVEFHMLHFEAPLDPTQDYRSWAGHMTVPNPTSNADTNFFYLASSTGGLGGSKLYNQSNYERLFAPL